MTQKALEETIARVEEEIRVQKEIFETDIVLIGKVAKFSRCLIVL